MAKATTRIDLTNRYFFGNYDKFGESLDNVAIPADTEVEIIEYVTSDLAYVKFAGYPLYNHMMMYTADIEVRHEDE